jgi:hypothetical protein
MPKRVSLVLMAAALVGATGCRVPNIPDLRAFEAGTTGMVNAVEGTYLATREVIDSAPLTPELKELHEQLERERAELETTWGPVREALKNCRSYARTLSRLVHQRDFSEGELRASLEGDLEGMFGPVGMLAGPLMTVPVGHELAKVAKEIDQIRQARRTLRRLRKALRVIHPAIGKLSGELRGDFKELHDWTARVFEILHEQNRVLHQEALQLRDQLDARERQIAKALSSLTAYAVHGHDLGRGKLPGENKRQQRQRLAKAEDAGVRKIRTEIHQALARVRQGKAAPGLRRNLEALMDEVLVLGPLAAATQLLGSGPPPSAVEEALARIRKERGEDLASLEVALARKIQAITTGGASAPRAAELQKLRGELVARIREHARGLTKAAQTGEGCDVEAALRGVLDAREVLGERDHAVTGELDRLLVAMMRRGVAELQAQIEAVRSGGKWPCGTGDDPDGPSMVASPQDVGALLGLEAEVIVLTTKLGEDAAEPEAREFEDVLSRVRRLRMRAEALGRLVHVDPDLSVPPPPTAEKLAAREAYWKGELVAVNEQRLAIQHHLESYAKRATDLEDARKHIKGLLQHGHSSLHAWERGHLNLAAFEGRSGDTGATGEHLGQAVADYHDQLQAGAYGAPPPADELDEDDSGWGDEGTDEGDSGLGDDGSGEGDSG